MSKQRYISVSFWDDEWIQTLDPSEKLLYLYLMTNPLTNIAGVYKITNRRICFDTGFNMDTVTHILRKFELAKKVYRKNEYIVIPNWPKHQRWEKSSKTKTGIDSILQQLDNEILQFLKDVNFKYPLNEAHMGHNSPSNYFDFDSDFDFDSNSDSKAHNNQSSKNEPEKKKFTPANSAALLELSKILNSKYNSTQIHNSSTQDILAKLLDKFGVDALVFILDGLSAMDPRQYNNPRFVTKFIEYRKQTIEKIKAGEADISGLDKYDADFSKMFKEAANARTNPDDLPI